MIKTKDVIILWMSKIILKINSNNVIQKYREIEKLNDKLIELKSNQRFNETCLNIYIYIYITIYILKI